jgi:hypothetical protein
MPLLLSIPNYLTPNPGIYLFFGQSYLELLFGNAQSPPHGMTAPLISKYTCIKTCLFTAYFIDRDSMLMTIETFEFLAEIYGFYGF